MLTATIFSSAFFWYNSGLEEEINRKSWKWEKIKREKRRILCQLLCGFFLQLLHPFTSHTGSSHGACGTLQQMEDQQRLWLCPPDSRGVPASFCLKYTQRLVFWVLFLRAVEKAEPIQSLISDQFFTWVITSQKLFYYIFEQEFTKAIHLNWYYKTDCYFLRETFIFLYFDI